MKALVEYIAKSLVDNPDEVEVAEIGATLLELRVADADRGKIIGRKGRTAHAIRTIITAATKDGEPPSLEIVD